MILAAGLSPAWQQILVFDRLSLGEVNRAAETYACASGKVINVGLALTSLGARSQTLSVLGGRAGSMIEDELASLGVQSRWIRDPANTRTCTTIIERSTGQITELVENAATIEPGSCDAYLGALQQEAATAAWVILSGSLPLIAGRSSSRTLYREMLERLPAATRVILDARGPEMLDSLPLRPFLVKPNREELGLTVGRELSDEASLIAAMQEVNQRGAEWVLVTHGSREVWLSSVSELWRFTPPLITVVNAIGCGDCLTAGLTAALAKGEDLSAAVRFGIAAAGENAMQLLPARLDTVRVQALAERVGSERMH